jgi:glycosyltransferase involved in cell wall biosynthesis
MSCGTPVIASNIVNASLKGKHNETILVVDQVADMITCIQSVLENDEQCETLSKNGRKFIEENFQWEQANKILLDILEPEIT